MATDRFGDLWKTAGFTRDKGKDSDMLVSQRQASDSCVKHGCFCEALAELQRHGVAPSGYKDGLRQRLLVLAQRLARVQLLGNEYARVTFSEHAEAVLAEEIQAVR